MRTSPISLALLDWRPLRPLAPPLSRVLASLSGKSVPGNTTWRALARASAHPERPPGTQNTRHTCRHAWPCRAARARAFRRVWHVRFRVAKPSKIGRFHSQTRFRITFRVLRIFQKFRAHQTPRVLCMSIEPKNVRQQWRNHFVSCFVRGLLLHVFNKFSK